VNHFELESLLRRLEELPAVNRGDGSEYPDFSESLLEVLEVIAREQPEWAARVQLIKDGASKSANTWLDGYLDADGNGEQDELLDFAIKHTLRRYWKSQGQKLQDGPETAECPNCGAQIDVAYIDQDGFRHAVCAICDSEWGIPRILCPWCGEKDAKNLVYYPYEQGYRLYHCKSCGRALPTADLREAGKLDLPKLRAAAIEMTFLLESGAVEE